MMSRDGFLTGGGARPAMSRRGFLANAARAGGAGLLTLGAGGALQACAPALAGSGTVPLPRKNNPVTWPVFKDNPPIKSGLQPETGATLFAHAYLLPQRGVYILENLNLEELARDRRWEFGFVGVALKLMGATGSPIRPLALV